MLLLLVETSEYSGSIAADFKRRVTGEWVKEDHHYCHQVQLQLYVCGSECSCCDFCVYTNKDIAVERIRPDLQWQQQRLPQLQD